MGHCQPCDHYQLIKWVGIKKYDQEYYEKYCGYEKTRKGEKVNAERWRLIREYLYEGSRVLDWGTGNGSFIRHKGSHGYLVKGYDINAFSPYFVPSPDKYLDVSWNAITLWDVLEHMMDPVSFLARLKTDYVFLLVPDMDCGIGECENERDVEKWKHFRRDEHQHYFTPESIERALFLGGFMLAEINRYEATIRDAKNPNYLMTVVGQKK